MILANVLRLSKDDLQSLSIEHIVNKIQKVIVTTSLAVPLKQALYQAPGDVKALEQKAQQLAQEHPQLLDYCCGRNEIDANAIMVTTDLENAKTQNTPDGTDILAIDAKGSPTFWHKENNQILELKDLSAALQAKLAPIILEFTDNGGKIPDIGTLTAIPNVYQCFASYGEVIKTTINTVIRESSAADRERATLDLGRTVVCLSSSVGSVYLSSYRNLFRPDEDQSVAISPDNEETEVKQRQFLFYVVNIAFMKCSPKVKADSKIEGIVESFEKKCGTGEQLDVLQRELCDLAGRPINQYCNGFFGRKSTANQNLNALIYQIQQQLISCEGKTFAERLNNGVSVAGRGYPAQVGRELS